MASASWARALPPPWLVAAPQSADRAAPDLGPARSRRDLLERAQPRLRGAAHAFARQGVRRRGRWGRVVERVSRGARIARARRERRRRPPDVDRRPEQLVAD